MTLNGVIALILLFSANLIALLANYVTVVEGRPIMSAKYCLPFPAFHFWPKLTHPTARSLCNSWVTCFTVRRPKSFWAKTCYLWVIFEMWWEDADMIDRSVRSRDMSCEVSWHVCAWWEVSVAVVVLSDQRSFSANPLTGRLSLAVRAACLDASVTVH